MRKLVCILFLSLSLPTWAQTSIVVNGSFEDRSNFLKGWDSAFGAGGLLVTPTAADGQNFAMITGDLFQDLPTIPGQVYQLRFALAGDPYWQGVTTLQIYWGGSLVASSYFNTTGHSNENLGWIYVTNNFLATLSTTRLWFGNPGYAVSTIPYLDAVTVIPVDASPTTCIPPPDGIMAWWPGQGTALDSVGGHNGTFLNGPGFTNGMVDKGFYFPGSNQCVQIPYAASLTQSNYSLEAWVQPLAGPSPGNDALIFGQSHGRCQLLLRAGSSGLQVAFQFLANGQSYSLLGSNEIPIGSFTHLTGTWDGTTLRLYIKGALDSELVPGVAPLDSGCPFFIGGFYNPSAGPCQDIGHFFAGVVDEPSYYARALSGAEIQLIYNAGIFGKCRIPVPPTTTLQPTSATVYKGQTVTFTAMGDGDSPLGYQWQRYGTNLFGKTGSSLTITNAQIANTGTYAVVLKNPAASVVSSNATLTVLAPPPCAPLPDGAISWWRAENDQSDGWDNNNGFLQFGISFRPPVGFVQGKVGNAFSFSTNCVLVPDTPSLRPTNGLTIEGWVFPRSFTTANPRTILSKFDPPVLLTRTNSGYYLGMINGLLFFALSPTGSGNSYSSLLSLGGVPTNQWSHVAATYDGAAMRIYLNSSLVAETNYNGNIFPGTSDLGLGAIPYFPNSGSYWPWNGYLDEITLYNHALSETEIAGIYNADLTGKCLGPPQIVRQPKSQAIPLGEDVIFAPSVVGSKPLRYQWFFNGRAIQLAFGRSLIVEKVQSNSVGNYSLLVSNNLGHALSSNAMLTLLPPPACTLAPTGMVSWWPADGSPIDAVGTNTAAARNRFVSGSFFATGKVDRAFNITNLAAIGGLASYFSVTNSASLNFGSDADFSIETWIKVRSNIVNRVGATESPTNEIILDKTFYPPVIFPPPPPSPPAPSPGYRFSIYRGHPACWLRAVSGRTTNNLSLVAYDANITEGFFHHLALTVKRHSTSGIRLYLDGALMASADSTTFLGSLSNSAPVTIGSSSDNDVTELLNGLVDELTIYNRALSPDEVQRIAQAGAAGKCKIAPTISLQPANQAALVDGAASFNVTADGTPNLRYQWLFNSTNIAGATQASLIITNVQLGNAGDYSVLVTNGFGFALSSNATLSINHPPVASCTNIIVAASRNCLVFASVDNGSFDPDGDSITLSQIPPGPYPVGYNLVTLIATDAWGASNFCAGVVTVRDVTPPTITCPTPIVRPTDPGLCGATVLFALPQASDSCSAVTNVTTTPASGSFFPLGDTLVQVSAADASGNVATCAFVVSVRDLQSPQLHCPSDIVVTNAHDAFVSVVAFQPTVSDNCPNPGQIVCQPASGSAFGVGTQAVVCSSADAAGNVGQCSFHVSVISGNSPPVPIIEISPLAAFPGYTNLFVITPNSAYQAVHFDGSKSYDIDDTNFSYFWYQSTNLFSTNSTASLLLSKGSHEITLLLDDHFPYGTNSKSAVIEAISPSDAVTLLLGLLDNASLESRNLQPLTATLENAAAAFDKGRTIPALNLLAAFQNQTRAIILPLDSTLSAELTLSVQLIIDAVHSRPP